MTVKKLSLLANQRFINMQHKRPPTSFICANCSTLQLLVSSECAEESFHICLQLPTCSCIYVLIKYYLRCPSCLEVVSCMYKVTICHFSCHITFCRWLHVTDYCIIVSCAAYCSLRTQSHQFISGNKQSLIDQRLDSKGIVVPFQAGTRNCCFSKASKPVLVPP